MLLVLIVCSGYMGAAWVQRHGTFLLWRCIVVISRALQQCAKAL